MFRVAIIGCGKAAGALDNPGVGEHYGQALTFLEHPAFVIAGVLDSNPARAKAFREKYSIDSSVDSLDELLADTRPNVVSITSPDHTHFDFTLQILEASEAVPELILIEKPVVVSPDELHRLRKVASRSSARILVNHTRRFSDLYRSLKKRIKDREFGDLLALNATYYGGWLHNGVHIVDTVRYLFDDEFANLCAVDGFDKDTDDPTWTVSGVFGQNKVPVWMQGWNARHYQIFDLEFRFDLGRLLIGNFEQEVVWQTAERNKYQENVLSKPIVQSVSTNRLPFQNMVALIEQFMNTRDDRVLESYSLEQATSTMRTLFDLKTNINTFKEDPR